MASIAPVVEAVDASLPAIARDVIERHLDLGEPHNRAFHRSPDRRDHHQTQWHQWGIITHTRVFLRHFDEDLCAYLERWGVRAAVDSVLGEQIDGVSRHDLLRLAILLHDLGKFAARRPGRSGGYHFSGHEDVSGRIIREELNLRGYGLTPAQVEYVARTAEDHFVLGRVRRRARDAGEYDAEFIESDGFAALAREIRSDHPFDYVEIGVLFLCDSLAKADPATGPPKAVSQYEVNLAAARRYLQIVTHGE